ncbi:oxidoreductase, FAD/FMN-binding family protein [Trichomonas vaginalis G3]|uniref:Oxidoreductase, FAD/FMN-binding family protein n=1 Tax=Trichomonas vaginalis (strain ATCC PRA-98 / G3) TaxID=412133 RepID=A2DBJ1_TRIV3|nr:FMN binding [Trichomonas vaginalis G3]EAY22194.1 oxidoreductase, FAD/FMN-binding family protein [Trichomonas vaginalis G3]KAI5533348.1 FMN binding [Trichomonas vaginalis G3]|eukprot:XP_001583180.1 oxidoreductase, FAD/FMN-binding family protein [Trichomonas vaginalis G3]
MSKLFTPVNIAKLSLKNRFMRSATYMGFCDIDGMPTQECLKYYRDLADGQFGLIVPGYLYPVPAGRSSLRQGGMSTDKHAEAWQSTIDYIHKQGSKIVFQIGDAGLGSRFEVTKERPRGASATGPMNRAMTQGDIDELIEAYKDIALRIKNVGADGIQVHSCHMYLLAQFLSPGENKRTDKYGGSPENRCRLHNEIISAIRSVVGNDFHVSIKINGDDYKKDGTKPEDAAKTVSLLKGIDLVEVSCGRTADAMARSHCFKTFPFIPTYNLDAAKTIKKANPNMPIACVGNFRKVTDMEKALDDIELISLSRPSIADTATVKHLMEGKKKVKCVSCGQCMIKSNGVVKCFI